jgi:pyridoxine 5-phosphate synthase
VSPRQLVVKLDHVAALRELGSSREPDPIAAAALARLAGAHGIAGALREDRRHIQERDLRLLRETVPQGFGVEIAVAPASVKAVLELRPDSVTLIGDAAPNAPAARSLDVLTQLAGLGEVLRSLGEARIRSLLCVDPDADQVKAAHRLGARGVQLASVRYADRASGSDELRRIADAARLAAKLGLDVAVGGGLDYANVPALLEIADLRELVVGHAIGARAQLLGMDRAVRDMRALVG